METAFGLSELHCYVSKDGKQYSCAAYSVRQPESLVEVRVEGGCESFQRERWR